MWAMGLIFFELLTGKPAFDPKLPLLPMARKMMGTERPALPANVRPEVKRVIESCWNADPAQRMTAAQVCELFKSVNWMLVDGADPKAVKACLARFPLEATASTSEFQAALEAMERENTALKAKVDAVTTEQVSLK